MHASASRWIGAADCLTLRPERRRCGAQALGRLPSARAQHPAASGYQISSSNDDQRLGSSGNVSRASRVQRALGVDYGRRVVGLAVSTLGLAPRPLEGVPGGLAHESAQVAASVLEVARREACDAVVVGLPVTQAGSLRRRDTDSQQGRRCRNFAANLAVAAEAWRIDVFLADEGGTTARALDMLSASGGRRSAAHKRKDSVAAALILETFFSDPQAALRVRPWRPQGGAQPQRQRGGVRPQRQQDASAS